MALLELVCGLKLYFDNKISPLRHTHIQRALLPGKWNSWDFNGQLTRWLDLWHWALSPSRQHMLLSAELSYVEGSASPSARERERHTQRTDIYSRSWQHLSSSVPLIKTTGRSSPHCLFLPHAVPVSVRPDRITTNPLSPVCGSSTWLLKEAKFSQIRHRPPHPPTHMHTCTHPSPHMYTHHSVSHSNRV